MGTTDASRARFVAGDPLRAVAALSVFVYHAGLWALVLAGVGITGASYAGAYGEAGARVLANLDVGLFLFFVLSGYLISRPFVHAFADGEPMPGFAGYARRRVLRIVPAFWFVVAVIMLRHGTLDSSATEIVAIFGFFQTFHHGGPLVEQSIGQAWTLHVEMGFYLLIPLAAAALAWSAGKRSSRRARIGLVLGATAGVAVASLALRHGLPHTQTWLRSIPTVLFAFTPGVALAAIETFAPARLRGARWSRALAYGLAAAGIGIVVAYAWWRVNSFALQGFLAAAGTGALVAAPLVLQWGGNPSWRVLDNRVMHWLGARSYSFYLVHTAVLWELVLALDSVSRPKVAFLVLVGSGFVASAAAAALTYQFVEKPFLALRRRPRTKHVAPEPALAPER